MRSANTSLAPRRPGRALGRPRPGCINSRSSHGRRAARIRRFRAGPRSHRNAISSSAPRRSHLCGAPADALWPRSGAWLAAFRRSRQCRQCPSVTAGHLCHPQAAAPVQRRSLAAPQLLAQHWKGSPRRRGPAGDRAHPAASCGRGSTSIADHASTLFHPVTASRYAAAIFSRTCQICA